MKTVACDDILKKRLLKASRNFNALDESQLRVLTAMAELRVYESGEALFRQGENAAGFFIVYDGAVAVFRTGMDGRRQILHVFEEPGDVCGEVPVFEGTAYPAYGEALAETRALYLRRTDFLAAARRHPELLLAMLATLSRRLRLFVDLVDDLSLKDVTARLAKYLVGLSGSAIGAGTFDLPTSKALLADRLGTISETVSRALRKLQEQGLIAVDGRRISVTDPEGLAALAEIV